MSVFLSLSPSPAHTPHILYNHRVSLFRRTRRSDNRALVKLATNSEESSSSFSPSVRACVKRFFFLSLFFFVRVGVVVVVDSGAYGRLGDDLFSFSTQRPLVSSSPFLLLPAGQAG